ncbi:antA/AntB antirepressor family protein [Symbiopectobacterium purcellii]|uniref:antA/AntB antirepressor family protein n=1 Tax=Symbiopectobacterium purcellii TaxID=2871826 RepID=UPI0020766E63|nr:antA/AntB antirepressor family protein [Symbiopectobacterium purcellii]
MSKEHQLIAIETNSINGEAVQTVNARDLHEFLKVGKDFSNWIKDRIKQYGFVENIDYVVFANSGENPNGGRPVKEYAISIDMAKELSMVERNEKGKEARQYFIQCEKQAKAAVALPQLNDPTWLRGMLLNYTEQVEELKQTVDSLENLFQVGMTPVKFCKQLNGVNIMGVNLFLAERNFLYDAQQEENKPYEWRVKAYARDKYFTEKTVTVNTEKGKKQFYEVILLKEGAKWLYRHYLKNELPMKKGWNGEFTHDKYIQAA